MTRYHHGSRQYAKYAAICVSTMLLSASFAALLKNLGLFSAVSLICGCLALGIALTVFAFLAIALIFGYRVRLHKLVTWSLMSSASLSAILLYLACFFADFGELVPHTVTHVLRAERQTGLVSSALFRDLSDWGSSERTGDGVTTVQSRVQPVTNFPANQTNILNSSPVGKAIVERGDRCLER